LVIKALPGPKAEALASVAEDQFCRVIYVPDGADRRASERVAHLVGLTATAILAASEARDKLVAVDELHPLGAGFTAADREWVLRNAPLTLAEVEKATLRLVAIRASRNMSDAAGRLGMAPVSLSRWIGRRKLPPMAPSERWP
jgi:hypothetical protein